MKKLNELFEVTYGHKLDLNKMTLLPRAKGGINFVGRSSQNHGVSGTVSPLKGLPPYEAGLITVALGGTKLLSSFVQEHSFYTAQNVAVLYPRSEMTFAEKLFVCIAIRHNRFKYSAFGREANRTLRELLIPDLSEFPTWVRHGSVESIEGRLTAARKGTTPALLPQTWKQFDLSALFSFKKGRRLTKADMLRGTVPFIGAVDKNNGLTAHVAQQPLHPGNTITVNYNGNGVAEAFYQPVPYRCSDDVNVLYPLFDLNPARALFVTTVIRREKYRFSYGRKWHLDRMKSSTISLPATANGEPDWEYMEDYVLHLPFSSHLPIGDSN